MTRVFNFGPGPAVLPLPVLEQVRDEMLDYGGLGASILEISHRTPEFEGLLNESLSLLRELMEIPPNYKVAFAHGGGQMQFSMVPLNLMALKPARKALYVHTGEFAQRAVTEAGKYGTAQVVASGEETKFARIPSLDLNSLDREASYLYIVTNNTVMGTRWKDFPDTGELPLVGDATSEILSRRMDVSKFGLIYAGAQKNLGPAGLSVLILREDLMCHALPETPILLDYTRLINDNSLTNTCNVFAIYVTNLVLKWLKDFGGLAAMEAFNEHKAGLLFEALDRSGFYRAYAEPDSRSTMNVTFDMEKQELMDRFVAEADAAGLYKVKGHRARGGIRASLYNAMPLEGVQALVAFMEEFERRNG